MEYIFVMFNNLFCNSICQGVARTSFEGRFLVKVIYGCHDMYSARIKVCREREREVKAAYKHTKYNLHLIDKLI